jgi:hypothetical protein
VLTEEQIEAIAQTWFDRNFDHESWGDRSFFDKEFDLECARFIANKAIAIQSEQDRRSFIAVGKYIGVKFTSETDVVSEVYNKLDEILTAFREHSQEIAIAQQIKTLNTQLEKYLDKQSAATVYPRAVGEKERATPCVGQK